MSVPTAAELGEMKRLVAEAMAQGAIGLGASYSPNHSGWGGIPMPSTISDISEFEALVGAMGGPGRGVVEIASGEWSRVFDVNVRGVFVATGLFRDLTDTLCPTRDIITGPGAGGGANIRVFDSETGVILRNFLAAAPGFILAADGSNPPTGTHVAAVDHNGTKPDDILVGYGEGANAIVNIFDFTNANKIDSFFAFNPLFQGGVYVASGH